MSEGYTGDAARERDDQRDIDAAVEQQAAAGDHEPEVRAEEFTAGIERPVGGSSLSDAVVDELRAPLDPNRVRTRAGRGTGKFEYLAGHDVKRRANEIFGFGNWGSTLVELRELGAVEVVSSGDSPRPGWHVAYSATVRVSVRGCLPVSDVGYGDGVEYGPAAFLTSRELAVKEASTDALKRALTQYGDQFGLILYAKADEKKRIQSNANEGESRGVARRSTKGAQPGVKTPRSWAEINEWAAAYGDEIGWAEWVKQASFLLYGTETFADLKPNERTVMGQKASGAIIALRENVDPSRMPPPTRGEIQAAWASVLDAQVLLGPPWRLDPDEAYPTHAEHLAATNDVKGEQEATADSEGGPPEDDVPWTGEAPV